VIQKPGSSPAPRDPNSPDQPKPRGPRLSRRNWWLVVGAVFAFNALYYYSALGPSKNTPGPQISISYTTLVHEVRAHHITTATVAGTTTEGNFRSPYRDPTTKKLYPRYTTTVPATLLPTLAPLLDRNGVRTSFTNEQVPFWLSILGLLFQALPLLFLLGLFYFGSRAARQQQQGVFGFGRSKAKVYTEERPSTTFADVAGVDAAKRELREIVDFLKDPTKYHQLGARIPRGVLLVGPPGTGKTLLARAVAGEARVAFFSISSTEFVEMFVGVGASRVRDLFERAAQAAPSIIFVDEIDAIGGRRGGNGPFGGSNDERESTLNQMLVSMDGFDTNQAVIVLGATNRPDVLDPALLRPGRFDRQVTLDPPDRKGREAILKIHTRSIPLASHLDLSAVAQATPGMSGADLANLANEAALTAARKGESQVTQLDFEEALDRITLGAEGPALMNEEERRIVAYHEAGHTLVAFLLPNVDPVHRVTITPRGRSLGVTQFRPIDDRRNYPRNYLVNRMAVGLGGRAAEELACNDITSGAQNDLQQVTGVARTMVTQLGMADELGPIYLGGAGDNAMAGASYNPWEPKEYSDETARRIDSSVQNLVAEAHQAARSLLSLQRETLDAIAQALIQDESLSREELTEIVNQHRAPDEEPIPLPTGEPTPIGELTPQLR